VSEPKTHTGPSDIAPQALSHGFIQKQIPEKPSEQVFKDIWSNVNHLANLGSSVIFLNVWCMLLI
jgi:hypothetical protein